MTNNNVDNYFEHPIDRDNKLVLNGSASAAGLITYADNTAALAGGLVAGDLYITTADNKLTIVV